MEMTPLRKSAKTRIPSEPWKSFAKALSFPTFPHSHIPDGDRYLRTEFSEILLQNLTHTTAVFPCTPGHIGQVVPVRELRVAS